jgi:hypothetical protein
LGDFPAVPALLFATRKRGESANAAGILNLFPKNAPTAAEALAPQNVNNCLAVTLPPHSLFFTNPGFSPRFDRRAQCPPAEAPKTIRTSTTETS